MEEKDEVLVICASCKNRVDYRTCYRMYVGMGSHQYICKTCQGKPFIEVMKSSLWAECYVGEPPKTLEELRRTGGR